ncbi:hypothetical protein [Microvirga sp. VF16]|uniref:hypothetical protein n=1 Tax=Microvirga sp. VF16 TaxID=2807101 RepID=UPI00193DB3D1|nr:hypothetical protein [Microvirga sp. VF16]QRM35837.1 hypothetical protein JO965_46455 [Microvirga sp. VF16]
MKPIEPDEFAKHRKLEAIHTELAQHRRMARFTLLLVVVLNVVILAGVAYHLLGHN